MSEWAKEIFVVQTKVSFYEKKMSIHISIFRCLLNIWNSWTNTNLSTSWTWRNNTTMISLEKNKFQLNRNGKKFPVKQEFNFNSSKNCFEKLKKLLNYNRLTLLSSCHNNYECVKFGIVHTFFWLLNFHFHWFECACFRKKRWEEKVLNFDCN